MNIRQTTEYFENILGFAIKISKYIENSLLFATILPIYAGLNI